MADSKITALTSISTSTDPANDPLVIVDVSDTSMAATGTTKKVTLNQLLGAGGTATLASATVTGNATAAAFIPSGSTVPTNGTYLPSANTVGWAVNSTNAMTLNSTGLGLATSPASALSFPIGTIKAVGMTAGTAHLPGNVSTLKFGINDGGGDFGGVHVFNIHNGTYSSSEIGFFTGEGGVSVPTQRMRIDKVGNIGIGVTPAGTGGCLQLKSGITFPATQVASSDANTLDDYEEGTWTGTLKGSVSDPTTPVTATGRYTKVGRLVSLQISFSNVNTTGASGDAYISGIPFTNANISVTGSAASFLALTFSGTLNSEIDSGGTNVSLFDVRSNNTWTSAQHNAGTSRYIIAEITYTV